MNKFTDAQLETIRVMAGTYYDIKTRPLPGLEEVHKWHKQVYIERITEGLTDPSYWG